MNVFKNKTADKNSRSAAHNLVQRKEQRISSSAPSNSTKRPKVQPKENNTGLPDQLKAGIENRSGYAMDDVKVHYNSDKPAQVQAYAFAQGTDIHLAPGQERHLAHEAWHVVQQKQGRVKTSGIQAKGISVNNDAGLEREADVMGAQLMTDTAATAPGTTLKSGPVLNSQVMQRLEVPTNFGRFKTTKFDTYAHHGLEIILKFHPDENKVDATKIGLTQSVKMLDYKGNAHGIDPTTSKRVVPEGKPGAGYFLDQLSENNNPIYSPRAHGGQLDEGKDLSHTPMSEDEQAELKDTNSYELGYCYKKKPKHKKKTVFPAGLWDRPTGAGTVGESKTFETTALAISGADKGTYYGSVKWGYEIVGDPKKPTVKKMDIKEESKGNPSANFLHAAKLWNDAKTRGTLEVIADPEADVIKNKKAKPLKLSKGTRLKQLKTILWDKEPAIRVRVLNDKGKETSLKVYIKNKDVRDLGDGGETIDLPLPSHR